MAPDTDALRAGARLARLGVLAALVSRIFGRLVGLVLVVVLARVSDPATVAVYGFILGTVTLMASVTDLGVASLAGRDVAAKLATAPEAVRSALGPQSLSAVLAVALTCAVAVSLGPPGVDVAVLVPSAVFVVANALFNLWAEVLRGAGRVVVEGLLQGASAVVLVVGGSLAVLAGADVVPLLWVVAAKELLVLAASVLLLRPARSGGELAFLALLRRSLWLSGAGTAVVVLWRQGTILVSALAPTAALADYVVASRFLDVSVTLAHTLGIGLFPAMAALAQQSRSGARSQVSRYLLLVVGVSVPLGLLGVALAGPVTTGLFGGQWTAAVPAVRAFALTAPVILAGYVLWFGLLAEHQERWLLAAATCGALTALVATGLLLRSAATATAGAVGTGLGASVLTGFLMIRFLATRPGPADGA